MWLRTEDLMLGKHEWYLSKTGLNNCEQVNIHFYSGAVGIIKNLHTHGISVSIQGNTGNAFPTQYNQVYRDTLQLLSDLHKMAHYLQFHKVVIIDISKRQYSYTYRKGETENKWNKITRANWVQFLPSLQSVEGESMSGMRASFYKRGTTWYNSWGNPVNYIDIITISFAVVRLVDSKGKVHNYKYYK